MTFYATFDNFCLVYEEIWGLKMMCQNIYMNYIKHFEIHTCFDSIKLTILQVINNTMECSNITF